MKYSDYMKSFAEATEKGSKTFSNARWEDMTAAAFDKESTVETYVSNGEEFAKQETSLHDELVTGLKKLTETTFGIKGNELNKLDDAKLPKEVTNTIAEWGRIGPIDYAAKGGKHFDFSITAENQFKTQLFSRDVEETVEDTTKNVQQADGTWKRVPTGKTVKTKAHTEVRAKRVAVPWLKEYLEKK